MSWADTFIATAASPKIGLGHFRRCSSLAIELEKQGSPVKWLVDSTTRETVNRELSGNRDIHELRAASPEIACSEISDLVGSDQLLIVDCYSWAATFDKISGYRWMRFDQGVSSQPTSAAYIHCALPGVDESRFANRTQGSPPQFLLGPQYALLGPNYRKARERRDKRDAGFKPLKEPSVVISMGGGDDRGATVYACNEVRMACPKARITIATTSRNPSLSDILGSVSEDALASVKIDAPDLVEVFCDCTFAVSAGGTTLNELACLGIPAVVLPIADNQVRPAQLWESLGFVRTLPLGCREEGRLSSELEQIVQSDKTLMEMSNAGSSAVDGLGACRTARALLDNSSGI